MILLFLVIGCLCCAVVPGWANLRAGQSDRSVSLSHRSGPAGEADALSGPMALAVHQDLCFVADTYNHVIKFFNFRQRELVRTIGRHANSPYKKTIWIRTTANSVD